jgi:excisionase family DNA binding protein
MSQQAHSVDRVFNVLEAAAHLRISRAQIYKLIDQNQLKPFKIGSRTLFTGRELQRLIDHASSGRQDANQNAA